MGGHQPPDGIGGGSGAGRGFGPGIVRGDRAGRCDGCPGSGNRPGRCLLRRFPLPGRCGERGCCPGGEDQGLEQRVGGEPVGAVDTRAGGLPGGVQAGHGGPGIKVGGRPAHPVVRGRHHRNGFTFPVPAVPAGQRRQRGKAAFQPARSVEGRDPGGVEPDPAPSGGGQMRGDPAGHDVARRQLRVPGVAGQEPQPGVVAQHRSLPADGFGDQRVAGHIQRGRMELQELQVPQPGAGPGGQGHAVAGGRGRVGGVLVHLPGPAGGEHDGAGRQPAPRSAREHLQSGCPAAVEQDADGHGFRQDGDVRLRAHRRQQGGDDPGPGGIAAHVQDAAEGVCRFPGQRRRAVGAGVEAGPGADQVPDLSVRRRAEQPDRFGAAVAGPRRQRVRGMAVRAVTRVRPFGEDGGDAALRPGGVALPRPALGHHDDVLAGAGGGGAQRGPESGQAGADDGDRHGRAASIRSSAARAGAATSSGTVIRLTTRPCTSSSSTHAR